MRGICDCEDVQNMLTNEHGCAGELPAVPASDHRRTAKKLAEAERWPEAVREAQEAGSLDAALQLRAIAGLAEQV